MNKFSKISGYAIHKQKFIVYLYTYNGQSEKDIRKNNSVTITYKV